MLKHRIITASFLLFIVLFTISYGSTLLVNILTGIVLISAALEWGKLIGLQKVWQNMLYICGMISICIICKVLKFPVLFLCLFASIWWIFSFFVIIKFPKGQLILSNRWIGFFLGCIFFIPTWFALEWLYSENNLGSIWVLFLCFLVWSADIGAYFTGKLWGKKKLIEHVSAGKTWLGVLGAFIFAFVIVLIFSHIWFQYQNQILLMMLGAIVVVFSILGDLTESLFKRLRGVKDSGSILPGHGGVLDRIDGFVAAVPTFTLVLILFQSCKG